MILDTRASATKFADIPAETIRDAANKGLSYSQLARIVKFSETPLRKYTSATFPEIHTKLLENGQRRKAKPHDNPKNNQPL